MKKTASREGGGDACKFQCTEEASGPNSRKYPSRECCKKDKSPAERNFDVLGLHLISAGKVGLLHGRNREKLH